MVNAQAQSAMATANFINAVGFDANRSAIVVDFAYETVNETTGESQTNVIGVPLLAMLPIPFIRVRDGSFVLVNLRRFVAPAGALTLLSVVP